jgi:hypothetical protein
MISIDLHFWLLMFVSVLKHLFVDKDHTRFLFQFQQNVFRMNLFNARIRKMLFENCTSEIIQ